MSDSLATASSGQWLPCWTLWQREMIRFIRQPSRVAGALGTPLIFWILVGSGLGRSFALPGAANSMTYLEFSFPGAIVSILMFTAIFSTFSIIEDRQEGFLQGVLVSPAPRASIVLGKAMGGTSLAVAQAALFLLLGPFIGLHFGPIGLIAEIAAMTLVSFAATCMGIWLAWRMESTQGFHAIMNLVLMPMIVISGAFFPLSGSSSWLNWIVRINPMTYGVCLLRQSLYIGRPAHESLEVAGPVTALAVSLLFAAVMFALSIYQVNRKRAE